MSDISDGSPSEKLEKGNTTWWKASLLLFGVFVAFAAVVVVWHWYISTTLPLAAAMREFYLTKYPPPHWHLVAGLIDVGFPILVLAVALGAVGKNRGILFLAAHALWLGATILGVMPLYYRWLPSGEVTWIPHGVGWIPEAWLDASLGCFIGAVMCRRMLKFRGYSGPADCRAAKIHDNDNSDDRQMDG